MQNQRCVMIAGLVTCAIAITFGGTVAKLVAEGPTKPGLSKAQTAKIVPVVTLKPGEQKVVTFSTWCTVGVTRGGGLSVGEMLDGQLQSGAGKSYTRGGVTFTVPGFDEAKKTASSTEYTALMKKGIETFHLTVAAKEDAQPGLFEMHLADTTCSGQCDTDFRVVIVKP